MARKLLLVLAAVALASTVSAADAQSSPFTGPVARATCQAGDLVETGVQGQVPLPDRLNGRAAEGYNCNLELIASMGDTTGTPAPKVYGGVSLDSYGDCLYQTIASADGVLGKGGTEVLDMSDSRSPVRTALLPFNPTESLRVHAARGLLAGVHSDLTFKIYNLRNDCRHPELLFSGAIPGIGHSHEGWFSADGTVYFAAWGSDSELPSLAIDVSDTTRPRPLATFSRYVHGGATSEDGTRAYVADIGPEDRDNPGGQTNPSALLIYDSSRIRQGHIRLISRMTLPNTQWSHGFFPVRYGDRKYLLQYGEHGLNSVGFGGLGCTSRTLSPFQYPNIIDISDERRPRIVATLMQEIGEPSRCASALNFDRPAFPRNTPFAPTLGIYAAFSYGTHLCRPDRLDNPTILACSGFASGLRVYDIRDPHSPRELAYFNPGTLGATDPAPDFTVSPPVVRASAGEIWFNSLFSGLQVVKFAPGVYPFKSVLGCTGKPDYLFAQYNPGICGR